MRNLTLAIDEKVLSACRKVAFYRNTTVNQLVRDFLVNLVREDGQKKASLARLRSHMREGLYEVGRKSWTRDDLHER
jgi:hypothetical protein